MKVETDATNIIVEANDFLSDDGTEISRNSFDVLSEIGMFCGVFLGTLSLAIILTGQFSEQSTPSSSSATIALFFSAILVTNGIANRDEIANDKKRRS